MTNSSKEPDWTELRSRFPVFQNKTYLNSCSYGALAKEVDASVCRYLEDRNEKGADWDFWVEQNEAVRNSVAQLIGAGPEEVAITASVSAGINSLASALSFDGPRNKVIITDFEFPTNAQIWYAQEMRGARVVRLAEEGGQIPLEKFEQAIDEDTLIVATAQVAFGHGAKQDIPAIAEIARRKGALMMVDGYQAFGTMSFDVRQAGVDFAVGGMLKYLLGTAGIAFLYIRQELIESFTPTATGWFAQEDIMAMDITGYSPSSTARRFEAGTPPVPNSYMAEAGMAILQEIGLDAVEQRIAQLTAAIKDLSAEAGYTIATPLDPNQHGAMIALRSHDENRLVGDLSEDNIVVSCRNGNLRISPHFYNDQADIDYLFRALHNKRELLV